jgi:hypothetical protein
MLIMTNMYFLHYLNSCKLEDKLNCQKNKDLNMFCVTKKVVVVKLMFTQKWEMFWFYTEKSKQNVLDLASDSNLQSGVI